MIRQSPPVAATRFANPFATCWTRPGALDWSAADGVDVVNLVDRLESAGRGQIVGPHGVGKTTLLVALTRELAARGRCVHRWTFDPSRRAGDHRSAPSAGDFLLVDGFEQLGPSRRWALQAWTRWRRIRLVVTSHQQVSLPVLADLQPELGSTLTLFDRLTAHRPTPVTRDDVAASYDRCEGNLREVWFDLYDLHERRLRSPQPVAVVAAPES